LYLEVKKTKSSGNFRVIGLIAVVGIFVFIVASSPVENSFQFSTLGEEIFGGYSSAYEGPKAEFYGVTYNGIQYSTLATHSASQHEFDTVMHFDADGASSGRPNINGEMTAIFLPEDTASNIFSWIPQNWLSSNQYVINPQATYNWNISSSMVQMKEYDMRWYVSFNSGWDGVQGGPTDTSFAQGEQPNPSIAQTIGGTIVGNYYTNLGVWIKFDLRPTWYIQGGGTAYFAIAECNLVDTASMQTKDNNGHSYPASSTESIFPYDSNDPLYLYYSPFGTGSVPNGVAEQYEGKNLNSAYFTSALYAHIDLQHFGVTTYPINGVSARTQGDVATFEFNIRVFVFGDYQVQDIQKAPDHYGLTTPTDTTGNNWLTGIIGWLSSPANDAILVGIIILALVIIFAPWVLVVFISLFKK
jgi:hypothetical protein